MFLHKRFLRASLFALIAYAHGVLNGWMYNGLSKQAGIPSFDHFERDCLADKIEIFSRLALAGKSRLSVVKKANAVRNGILHFTRVRDSDERVFRSISLSLVEQTEKELAQWMGAVESAMGLERSSCHEILDEFADLGIGVTTKHVCSDTQPKP